MSKSYKWPTKSDGHSFEEYVALLRLHMTQDFDSEEGKATASELHRLSLKLTKPEALGKAYAIYFDIRPR